ncbi:hypothetical protein [Polynucleobacter sp. MWH-S4W17]|jgi:hypothetical protein|uniref:hypothetical protein n=1 Tax=Polynucleobacter sp. MWH-S4W17 TaxID=1855910 RepID=UPI001BFEE720|nr:hypothetical protein [Polynucleobacter sp. MWH-S4W17]QWD82567.1 hypothetical protein C2755_05335 [Polynucleobacter sp. MWH-S4W17]
MNANLLRTSLLVTCTSLLVAACSTAKLEARLEANPQCKEVVNSKTGALMPCPGSDKSFYREVGLAPAKSAPVVSAPINSSPTAATSMQAPLNNISTSVPVGSTQTTRSQVECKPQIHKKTGGTMPCPAPD